MTEFPLLCTSPHCRPAERGGPRRTNRAWVCDVCVDQARQQLDGIAAAWPDLQESLARAEHISDPDQGHQKNGGKSHGTLLNEAASDAAREATRVVWFMVRCLLDDYDEQDRTLTLPKDQDTPTLAAWLSRWHVDHFASHPGDTLALEVLKDVRNAARMVRAAAYPSGGRRVETGLLCEQHSTSDAGERVPCPGAMYAWVQPGMTHTPDLVCSEDDTHRIDPATWQRAGWKARHNRMHTAGVKALVGRIGASA